MSISYEKFITGPLDVNTYLVRNQEYDCLIIDPSSGLDEVIAYIQNQKLKVHAILLTHGHFDHIMGIPEVLALYPDTAIYIHPEDVESLRNPVLNGSILIGQEFSYTGPTLDLLEGEMKAGVFTFEVLHVPGHTRGGCAVVFENVCFAGDSIFAGSIGRTDLPGGNTAQLLSNIREKLFSLSDQVVLCPGHGGRTTVGRERRLNPFLQE